MGKYYKITHKIKNNIYIIYIYIYIYIYIDFLSAYDTRIIIKLVLTE